MVLIETLWNVNFIAQTFIDTCGYVLIETLWNVKDHLPLLVSFFLSINRNIVECKV